MQDLRKKILGLYTNQPRKKVNDYSGNDEYVLVKPLDSISVNDVYEIIGEMASSEEFTFEEYKQLIIELYDKAVTKTWVFSNTPYAFLRISDLLRDRGYAIPAFDHSVQELIEEKIFKYAILDIIPPTFLQDTQINVGAKKKANKSKRFSKMIDPNAIKDNYFNDEL